MTWRVVVAVGCAVLAVPGEAIAQFKSGNQTVLLELPRVSPRAVLTQRIGLTDVTIAYHRPQVAGRTIFPDLVPYGKVWRAGANDNTIIEFADPVAVEGHPLPAGRYGLHMIPNTSEWIVIFSKNTTSWGSFSYDQKEDALRVTIKPAEGAFHELLTYEVTAVSADTATIALEWGRLSLPLHVAVDTHGITLARVRDQLRHLPGYKAEAWLDAVQYCLDEGINFSEALTWVDRAIALEGSNFTALDLKAQVLEQLGRNTDAASAQAEALKLASPNEIYFYGDRLLRDQKVDVAMAVFVKETTTHSDRWLNWYGLARAQIAKGDTASARKSLQEALTRAPGPGQRTTVQRLLDKIGR